MRTIALGLLVAVLASVGIDFIDPYVRFLAAQLAVVVIAVVSLNLLGNVAGMLSLASAAFMGLGAYGALILLTLFNIPLAVAIPVTVAAGWLVGWFMGLVAVRLSGLSLAIVTFGFIQVFQVFAKQGGVFAGDGYGLILPPVEIPGLGALTPDMVSLACIFVAIIVITLTITLTDSRIGRSWYAMKENPVAAEMQGVNLLHSRAQAFAVSGAITSVAGILQALLLGITNPALYTIDASIGHLTMMVVGGSSGSVTGAILGPAILYFLPEYFQLGAYKEVLYGVTLLLTLALAPLGMSGLWTAAVRHLSALQIFSK